MGNNENRNIVLEPDYQDMLAASWRMHGDHRGCYQKVCRFCGKMFYARRPKGKYCASACRQREYRKRRKNLRGSVLPLE